MYIFPFLGFRFNGVRRTDRGDESVLVVVFVLTYV